MIDKSSNKIKNKNSDSTQLTTQQQTKNRLKLLKKMAKKTNEKTNSATSEIIHNKKINVGGNLAEAEACVEKGKNLTKLLIKWRSLVKMC